MTREPEPPETDPELEQTIRDLIKRKYDAPEGSAARRLAVRELAGLRYSREGAGGIIESLDPDWGEECVPNPSAVGPGRVMPMQRRPRRK